MKNNYKDLDELLDDFIDNKISLEEVDQMNGVEDTEQIKNEAALHQLAVEAVVQYGIAQQISKVHSSFIQAPVLQIKRKRNDFIYWSVRIAAMLVLMLGTFMASRKWIPDTQTIYTDTFQAYYLSNERSLIATEKSNSLVVANFKTKNYQQVIIAFKQLDAPTRQEQFLTGYAYLVTQQLQESITLFEKILADNQQTGNLNYQDDAEYYLALVYLKNNEINKAKMKLEMIHENIEHTYHENINSFDLKFLKWFY